MWTGRLVVVDVCQAVQTVQKRAKKRWPRDGVNILGWARGS